MLRIIQRWSSVADYVHGICHGTFLQTGAVSYVLNRRICSTTLCYSNDSSNRSTGSRSTPSPRSAVLTIDSNSALDNEETDDILPDANYKFARDHMRIPGVRQQVFLIQPRVTWGPRKLLLTTPELQLEENKTLLHTLGWEVVDSIILNVESYDSTHIFGSGNFEKLAAAIRGSRSPISALCFGANILKKKQLQVYKEAFGLPIYDRYRIVLQIFRSHAKTKEAKLQVALAELPYLRTSLLEDSSTQSHQGSRSGGSGSGESWRTTQHHIFRDREAKIKSALDKIRANRSVNRKSRIDSQIPSIAVVGYTNAGKTCLIKALTNDSSLVPENKLFATLDVTSHAGVLPNNISVLYLDTIGFISDIPTMLIASFSAVLEEIALADVIVHVRDISHPDTNAQKETVLKHLADLQLPDKLLNTIVEVCNKCDKIPNPLSVFDEVNADADALFVSATTSHGIYELRERVQTTLLQTSGLSEKVLRIPQSGKELSWLYREAHVHIVEADPSNSEYLVAHVTISPASFAKFVHEFRKVMVLKRSL